VRTRRAEEAIRTWNAPERQANRIVWKLPTTEDTGPLFGFSDTWQLVINR